MTETSPSGHPVSLTPACIRAILAGRKTQLRHAVREPSDGCPLGQAGDLLWVREGWALDPHTGSVRYQADSGEEASSIPWQPARTMPPEASRLHLMILQARLERVQEIGDRDLQAEGGMWRETAPPGEGDREGFARWWSQVQAKSGLTWENNPWVWAVEFTATRHPPAGAAAAAPPPA